MKANGSDLERELSDQASLQRIGHGDKRVQNLVDSFHRTTGQVLDAGIQGDMSDDAITDVYVESVRLYKKKVQDYGLQINPVISESGILQYQPDREAVQLAVAQRREEARKTQSRLMTEVMNNSQLPGINWTATPSPQGLL